MPSESTCAVNASRSVSCSSVKLCALVPAVGTPYRCRAARFEVVREARDVRRPGRRHRGLLVRTARAHLDAGPVAGGAGHPGGRGGDRGVVVVDRQQHRLEQHRLGERRLDHEQRGVGEVGLALRVAPHVAGEAVAGQPLQRPLVDDGVLAEHVDRFGVEAEPLDRVERASDAGHDAVPAALGEPAREHLEHRPPLGRAAAQRRLQHGQLVVVGEERRRGDRSGSGLEVVTRTP